MENDSPLLFDNLDEYAFWWELWQGMPEYSHEDLEPLKTIKVHFESIEDMRKFAEIVEQKIGPQTRSIWFPSAEIGRYANKRYSDES